MERKRRYWEGKREKRRRRRRSKWDGRDGVVEIERRKKLWEGDF